MAGVLAVSCAKNDLMSGLDDHNAEEICFSMAPVRTVTSAATGFSNFPTLQTLRKPCANPVQTTGTQEWLWQCWEAIMCG